MGAGGLLSYLEHHYGYLQRPEFDDGLQSESGIVKAIASR